MGIRWPKSNVVEWDNNGERATGALVYFYNGGTTTPLTTYEDADLTTPHEHPVEADGNGRWPAIYLDYGSYDEKITTSSGTQLSYDEEVPNPEPTDPSDTVDENALLTTGDIWFSPLQGTRSGAVRCNGRTIGNATSGGTERANEDTSSLFSFLWTNLANGQAAVSTGRGASAAADYAASKTIALPDLRGAFPLGLDDMGNSAASLLGSAPVVHGTATTPGAVLGANTHTLTTSEAPAHTHAVSITTDSQGAHTHTFSETTSSNGAHQHTFTGDALAGHTHTQDGNNDNTHEVLLGASGANALAKNFTDSVTSTSAGTPTGTIDSQGAHTHTVSGTTSSNGAHTHLVSGTSASTGGGTAHNNVQRGLLGTWFMKL